MKRKLSAQSFVGLALVALIGMNLVLAVGPQLFGPKAADSVYEGFAVAMFIANLGLVAAILCGIGYAVTGYLSGIALSSWNDYSLSKLQMALWTIVVLAGLFTVVSIRLIGYFGTVKDPLDVTIPGDLLAAMGIAAFTTAATPAILAMKAAQDPDADQIAVAKQRVSQTSATALSGVSNTGNAIGRASPDTASWLDILTGDEASNAGIVDVSKVQQLLITILLLGAYCGMIIRSLAQATRGSEVAGLPLLDSQFVGLLAVSHAGYLAYKVVPKSGQTVTTNGAGSTSVAASPAPAAQDTVTLRLAIEDAANTTALQLTVDGTAASVGSDGFAELDLETGVSHTITAQGSRGGATVRGTLTITPTPDDIDGARSLKLE